MKMLKQWSTNGVFGPQNIPSAVILADTGELSAAIYRITVAVSCPADAYPVLELYDPHDPYSGAPAQLLTSVPLSIQLDVPEGFGLRVRTLMPGAGFFSASILLGQ